MVSPSFVSPPPPPLSKRRRSSLANLPEPTASTSKKVLYLDTVEGETALLRALLVHRPFGLDKHWAMLGIHSILSERDVTEWKRIPEGDVWRKVHEFYDREGIEDQVSRWRARRSRCALALGWAGPAWDADADCALFVTLDRR